MLIKISFFLIFIVIWIGLAGLHQELQLVAFLILAPLISLAFAIWLRVLPTRNYFKIRGVFYFFWLLKEILMSAIEVVKISWRRNLAIQPMLEPIESIQTKDIGIVTYANSITLTPGTVTLSVEGKVLLVHALDIKFMDDLQEGEMDNRVKKIVK